MAEDLCFLSAHELVRGYRSRSISPVEVTRAILEHIAEANPHLNALYFIDAAGALAAARSSEERWRRSSPQGVLDGVPVTLKDSIRVAGMPAPQGTSALAEEPLETTDSPVTARLREDGAVILGKTTMPDLGMIASGVSTVHGVTRNPWNRERNSGGSSSGAGVAVAAGFGPLAVGSDIGGSVRIPSAFCGVVGHKPSFGRVPIADPWPMLVAGPMTRSVTDAAMLLGVISRPDPRDCTALPWDDRDYLENLDAGVRGLRIGLLLDMGFGLLPQPDVRARVEAAAKLLSELGADVQPMPPMFDTDPEPDFDRMVQAYASPGFCALPPERQALVRPEIADWCRAGAGLAVAELIAATVGIGNARARVLAACANYDFVISPTMAVEAFPAELPWPEGGTRHNPFCFPFNLSEQPALSLCCGLTSNGLPVGLQIVGKRFDDAGVLRVGRAYEAARPPLPDVPLPRRAADPSRIRAATPSTR